MLAIPRDLTFYIFFINAVMKTDLEWHVELMLVKTAYIHWNSYSWIFKCF